MKLVARSKVRLTSLNYLFIHYTSVLSRSYYVRLWFLTFLFMRTLYVPTYLLVCRCRYYLKKNSSKFHYERETDRECVRLWQMNQYH